MIGFVVPPGSGCRCFRRVGSEVLESFPAEVGAAGAGERRVVELLEAVLADVGEAIRGWPPPVVSKEKRKGCRAGSCRDGQRSAADLPRSSKQFGRARILKRT